MSEYCSSFRSACLYRYQLLRQLGQSLSLSNLQLELLSSFLQQLTRDDSITDWEPHQSRLDQKILNNSWGNILKGFIENQLMKCCRWARGKSSVLIRLQRFAKMRIFCGNVIRVSPVDNLYQTLIVRLWGKPGGVRSRDQPCQECPGWC